MAPKQPLPNISEDELIDLAGGATMLLAKGLIEKGKVKKANWTFPEVKAVVDDGKESREACWNLRSITFQRNECACEVSLVQRKLCVHSLAAYLVLAVKEGYLKLTDDIEPTQVKANEAKPADEKSAASANNLSSAGPKLRTINLSPKKGTPIEVRFIIPPNIATSSQRDEIICRLELRIDDVQV
ncbi:MAG: hypothetical protein WCJ77_02065, partial [Opitutae bacterium]